MILSICSEPRILAIIRIVKIAITIIKIAVPIMLIISCMIDFVRATISGEVNESLKGMVKRVIAALLIFLIPTFVSILANISTTNNEYINCFKSATKEGVREAYVKRASQLVLDAKNTLNSGTYAAAKSEVEALDEGSDKEGLKSQLAKVNEEIEKAKEEWRKKEEERRNAGPQGGTGSGVNSSGKYSKAEIIAMSEDQVRAMSNQEFIEFMASAARIVYEEYGGVLPSITIAQAILESGWGNSFTSGTHNVFGLIGYPGHKPKIGVLRQFDNFYEATYYHYAYFQNYTNVYSGFLARCEAKDALGAASYLYAYANGSKTYAPSIQSLISQYNLTQYDY